MHAAFCGVGADFGTGGEEAGVLLNKKRTRCEQICSGWVFFFFLLLFFLFFKTERYPEKNR